jgi:hypothetical protein
LSICADVSVLAPPLNLEPAIVEAKQRAGRRRVLLVAAGLAAVGAATATFAVRSLERARPALVTAPACRAGQLSLAVGSGGVAGGSAGEDFTFENNSNAVCALRGWPKFTLVMRDGRHVMPRPHDSTAFAYSVENPPPVPTIRLGSGAKAQWYVQAADGTGLNRACPVSRAVLVVPPGAHGAIGVAASLPFCGPRFFSTLPIGRAP